MSTSVPLTGESPAAITHSLFLVGLVVLWGADRAVLLSPNPLQRVFSVSRGVKCFCKATSGCKGTPDPRGQALRPAAPHCFHLPLCGVIAQPPSLPPAPSVSGAGEFWAVWAQVADC